MSAICNCRRRRRAGRQRARRRRRRRRGRAWGRSRRPWHACWLTQGCSRRPRGVERFLPIEHALALSSVPIQHALRLICADPTRSSFNFGRKRPASQPSSGKPSEARGRAHPCPRIVPVVSHAWLAWYSCSFEHNTGPSCSIRRHPFQPSPGWARPFRYPLPLDSACRRPI